MAPRGLLQTLVAAVFLLLGAAPTLAAPSDIPSGQFGFIVGLDRGDEDLVGTGDGAQTSALLGLRWAVRLNPRWNWFADGLYTQHETPVNEDSKIFEGRTGVERLFPLGEGPADFYLAGALGGADVNFPSGLEDFGRPLISLGVGVARRGSGLRAELRAEQLLGNSGLGGADVTNVQFIVGYTFGLFSPGATPAKKQLFEPGKRKLVLEGVNFEFDSARLTSDSYAILDRVVESLRDWPEVRVEVGGHTDAMGTHEYNVDLSQRRAETVRDYLTMKGIGRSRLEAKGYGETEPVTTNETDAGRAKNRRVELKKLGD